MRNFRCGWSSFLLAIFAQLPLDVREAKRGFHDGSKLTAHSSQLTECRPKSMAKLIASTRPRMRIRNFWLLTVNYMQFFFVCANYSSLPPQRSVWAYLRSRHHVNCSRKLSYFQLFWLLPVDLYCILFGSQSGFVLRPTPTKMSASSGPGESNLAKICHWQRVWVVPVDVYRPLHSYIAASSCQIKLKL